MRNKEEIKRIDGKYYLVRELEMDGEPVPHESGMLQCVKSIDDDDCQHCCLYGMDRCGDTCSPYGFMVRVLPENSEEKIEENLSNMEETGENLKTEKEETTMKSEQALSVEEMKLKVFINKLDASCGIGTLLVAARNKAEADAVAMDCEDLEFVYWNYDDYGNKVHSSYNNYPRDGWKEMQGVSYEGEPCVLHEKHYYE